METKLLTIQEVADLLGVSTKTLRRWEARGKLIPQRTKGNQRRYTQEEVLAFSTTQENTDYKTQAVIEDTIEEATDQPHYSPFSEIKHYFRLSPHTVKAFAIATGLTVVVFLLSLTVMLLPGGRSVTRFGDVLERAGTSLQKVTAKTRAMIGGDPQQRKTQLSAEEAVLAAKRFSPKFVFTVGVPSTFKNDVTLKKDLYVDGLASISGQLTAPNILYGVTAGAGIAIGEGQNPVITNTGVTSFQGVSGALELEAGEGITLDGLTVTNDDPGSAQEIFKNIKAGGSTITAGSNDDTLEFAAGTGISLSTDTSNKKITISGTSQTATGWLDDGTVVRLETASDSVGIGTANPSSFKLQVAGDIGPDTNNTSDLGSSLLNWRSLYLSTSLALGSDTVSDLTGSGLYLSGAAVNLDVLTSADGTGSTSSNSGLELQGISSNSLTLLQGCNANQVLKWDDGNNVWACGNDVGGTGATINVAEGATTYVGIDTVQFDANDFDVANITTTASVTLDSSLIRFRLVNGAITSSQTTADFLLGSTATSSAKFGLINVNSGTPTATISAGTSGGIYIAANGSLQTTANQSLTLGGNSTGNITLSPFNGNGTVTSTGNLNLASGKSFQINGTDVLTSTTLGATVVNSSLTSVGILDTGSITAGFGNIDIGADGFTGGDFSSTGTTGFTSTGAGAGLAFGGTGNHDISASSGILRLGGFTLLGAITGNNQSVTGLNNLSAAGAITFSGFSTNGGLLYTNGSGVVSQTAAGNLNQCLLSVGGGTPVWGDCVTGSTVNHWNATNGALFPTQGTQDLLIGSSATTSARFAVLNVNSGTPIASVSAGTSGGMYITASGNLATTTQQPLTIGGATTGTITLSPNGGTDKVNSTGTFNLSNGKTFQINNTDVLTSSSLGAGVVSSSLTSVGILTSGTWHADVVEVIYGGTGLNTVSTGDLLYGSGANTLGRLAVASDGQILSISGGVPAWISATNFNYFQRANGAIAPVNTTDDLLLGSTATSSARIGFVNIAGGTPVATLSAGTSGATYLTAAGTLQTTAGQTLTIGGSTTGNIVLDPLNQNGTVTVMGNVNLALGKALQINTADVLTSTTLGTTVVNSSLTSVGTLTGGSIASGFGTIATNNTITGTTLNGTTGINSGAGAGSQRIDGSGNLTNIGTTQLNGVTYTWPGADGTNGYVLSTNSSGGLSWIDVSTATTNFWTQTNGTLYPKYGNVDFLIGGSATSSAKFAVLNMDTGTPVASVSAGSTGGIYLAATGTLGTTTQQSLRLGSASTGNIEFYSTNNLLTSAGNLTLAGNLDINGSGTHDISGTLNLSGNTLTSSGDLTINPTGTNVLFSNGVTLNVGGAAAAAFNFFGGSTATNAIADSDNDLYIEDELEVDGGIRFDSSTITLSSFTNCTALETDGSGVLTCGSDDSGVASTNYWQLNNGSLAPFSTTADLLLGSTATSSAKFGFINVNSGTPTATISAGTSGGIYITANGTIQATANQALTLGGNTTGALTLSPLNGSGALNLNVGSLSINSNPGTTAGTPTCVTTTNGIVTGTGNCDAGSGGSKWELANGALSPIYSNVDVLFGGTATNSAKFAFINNNTGTPVASISANSGNNAAYLTGSGNLATTNLQALTIGGTTTGAITIDVGAGSISLADDTTLSGTLSLTGTISDSNSNLVLDDTVDIGSTANGLQISTDGVLTDNNGTFVEIGEDLQITGNDILSSGGTTAITLSSADVNIAGDLTISGGDLTSALNTNLTITAAGTGDLRFATDADTDLVLSAAGFANCSALETVGNVITCGSDDTGVASTNYWQLNNGAVSPFSSTADLLLGGTATSSAKFAFINNNTGTPTASISAGTSGGVYINAAGTIAATAGQSLTLGDGTTTGNVQFFSSSNTVNSSGNLTLAGVLDINGAGTHDIAGTLNLSGDNLSSSGDLTLTAGGGNILFANNTTLNVGGAAATAYNFFAGSTAGSSIADSDNDLFIEDELEVDGAVILSNNSLTFSAFTNCTALETNGSGVLQCGIDDGGGNTQYWQMNNGAIAPFSNTADLLIGATATTSAKFAFVNVDSGTPTASISAGVNGGIYLTATGSIATTANQAITIGNSGTSGNIQFYTSSNSITSGGNLTLAGNLDINGAGTHDIAGTLNLSGNTLTAAADLTINAAGNNILFADGDTLNAGGAAAQAYNFFAGTTTGNTIADGDNDLYIEDELEVDGGVRFDNSSITLSALTNCTALETDGSGVISCGTDDGTGMSQYWQMNNGTVSPFSNSLDVLFGGTASSSAKFAFLNNVSGTPTASVSANSGNNAIFLTGDGNLATTNMQNLTIGGSSTGTITLSPNAGNNKVNSTGTFNLSNGKTYQINNSDVLSSTALGTSVVGSSLTSVGTIATGVWNGTVIGSQYGGTGDNNAGTTGVPYISGGDWLYEAALDETRGGTGLSSYTAGDLIYASGANTLAALAGGAGNEGRFLTISGGVPTWATTSSINYWQQANGILSPLNITNDLILGGTATASARAGFINIAGGTPTATVSANSGNNATFFTGDGNIATTNMQNLTVGGATTGTITLSPAGGNNKVNSTGTFNLSSGKTYQINNSDVLSSTALGTTVVGSSLTSVGTIATGVWNGTAIGSQYGGTGDNNVATTGVPYISSGDWLYEAALDETRGGTGLASYTTGDLIYASNTNTLSALAGGAGNEGKVLTISSGVPAWLSTSSINFWQRANGSVSPLNITDDLLLGGISTASARFSFTNNIGAGTPTASISANSGNNATFINGAGNIATTNMQNLSIGGSSTGTITLSPAGGNNKVNSTGTFNLANGKTYQINNADVLSSTALGTTVVGSSLTSVGTLTAGTWNASVIGPTYGGTGLSSYTTGDLIYASNSNTLSALAGGAGNEGKFLSISSGVPAWVSTSSINFWQRGNGSVAPLNITDDLLLGSTGTTSAKFAFANVAGGTPTASISASSGNNATYLSGAGTLATTNMQNLTIGGATTGGITLTALNGTGAITANATTFTLSGTTTLTGSSLTLITGGATAIDFSEFDVNASTGSITINDGGDLGNISIEGTILDSNSLDFAAAGTITTTGANDLTLTPAGGNVILSDNVTLNVGGAAAAAYNFFASSTGGNSLADGDNDLYVEDEFEVDGAVRFDNSSITLGNAAFANCATLGTSSNAITCGSLAITQNLWQTNNGTVSPFSNSLDVLFGGTASTSAKFAFLNNISGTPVASISANSGNNATYLNGTGTLSTTNMQNLTIGGATTGTITLSPAGGNNKTNSTGTFNLSSGKTYQINDVDVLSATALGTNVVGSSLTSVGTIATGVWNGTAIGSQYGGTGQNFASATGVPYISGGTWATEASLDETRGGTGLSAYTTGDLIYASNSNTLSTLAGGAGNEGKFLSISSGVPAWVNTSSINFWQRSNGIVAPLNVTDDLLLGGTATTSAKFAFFNVVGAGTPTASLSAGTNSGTYLTADGTLATKAMQTLTLGNATTGNVVIDSGTSLITLSDTTSVTGDLSASGTTGLTLSGSGADISFSGGGTNILSSSGTLQINAFTLGGTLAANAQTISGIGTASFGNNNVSITGTTVGLTSDTDLLSLVNNALTVNGSITATGDVSFQGNTAVGNAVTDTITFTGRVAQDSDLLPITTTGTSDLGSSDLPWDNIYANNIVPGGTSGANGWWQRGSGTLAPYYLSDDLLLGNTATASAKAGFINIATNTPTATISANSGNNATFLTGAGNLATTNMQNLTIGGATTGNIAITALNSNGTITANATALTLSGTTTLTGSSLTSIVGGATAIDFTEFDVNAGTGSITINDGGNAGNINIESTVLDIDSLDFTSTGAITTGANDLTITPAGGNVLFGNNVTLNVGGAAATAYNFFAGSTAGSSIADGDDDLYIADEFEVDGAIRFDNSSITLGDAAFANCTALETSSGVLTCGVDDSGGAGGLGTGSYWRLADGALSPFNSSLDVLLGGTATASAKLSFININTGTPTATVSANSGNNATFLTGLGNLATTNMQNLTIGGATTGTITLSPAGGNNKVNSTGVFNLSSGKTYQINDTDVLSATTLGTAVVTSSLTTVGALNSGSITSGFGAIDVGSDNITGGTLNGTTGINTGAAAGTQRIDSSGNLTNIGTTQFNTITYTWPSSGQSAGYALTTNGSGTLSWADPVALASNWNVSSGVIRPKFASVVDLLLGSTASSSAKFGVLNVLTGTPTATISANSSNNATFLTGLGNLGTTNMQNLSIGGATTGAISLTALNGSGAITASASTLTLTGTTTLTGSSLTTITGGATAIDFTEFDVNAGTGSITINDGGNAGNINIESTVLDIDSLDFTSTGAITTGANDLTITPAGGNVLFGNNVTINVGGAAAAAYNFFAGATGGSSLGDADNDLYVEDEFEVDGAVRFDSATITLGNAAFTTCATLGTSSGAITCGTTSPTQNYWQLNNGAISPFSNTADLLLGNTASSSAKFAFLNNVTGTPIASVSANSGNNATFLTGLGNLATTNMQQLSLGGATTGDISINARNGAGTLTFSGTQLTLTGTTTLTGSSLTTITGGATAIDFSEFDVAAGTGSITINDGGNAGNINIESTVLDIDSLDFTGAGTITTTGANDLTLTPAGSNVLFGNNVTLNVGGAAAAAYNFFAGATGGSSLGDADNDLYIEDEFEVDGAVRFDSATITLGNAAFTTCATLGTSSGAITCGTNAVTQNYWQMNNGAISPFSNSADVLFGNTASSSAKFAFLNNVTGTPIASVSANSGNNATFLTGLGNLATTNMQQLSLGGATTGDISINARNGAGTLTFTGTQLTLASTTTITGSSLTTITGGATAIDFSEFDVAAGTGSITINDGGNAGSVNIESTVLDIDSHDFTAAGLITTGSGSNLTLTPGGAGDTILSVDADSNLQITAGGASGVDMIAVSNTAQPVTATTIDGMQIDFATTGTTASADNAALRVNVTSNNNGATTTLEGVYIGNLTSAEANSTETALRIGTGWDSGITVESGGISITGGAISYSSSNTTRPTRTIKLSPEYAGAILTASGSATITGSMTSDASPSANFRTYYEWDAPNTSTLQDYTVAVRVTLPQDFSAWSTSNAMTVEYNTERAASADDKLDVYIYNPTDSSSNPVYFSTANVGTAKTWSTVTVDDSVLNDNSGSDWDAAGETVIIYLKLYSRGNFYTQVGDIDLSYQVAF